MKLTMQKITVSIKAIVLLTLSFGLFACNSVVLRQPVQLPADPNLVQPQLQWQKKLGGLNYPVFVQNNSVGNLAFASENGQVQMVSAKDGAILWQAKLGASIQTAAANDGVNVAVITNKNQLILLRDGEKLWSKKLAAVAFSSPQILAGRVFVNSAENLVLAFDVQTGNKIWQHRYKGKNLTLKATLSMLPIGNELVVGELGNLIGLQPVTGYKKWEVALNDEYYPNNELEQMQLVVGKASRLKNQVCVNLYDTSLSCVDVEKKRLLWATQTSRSYYGVAGDKQQVYTADKDGVVRAFNRDTFELSWKSKVLHYHGLREPVILKNLLAVGDGEGFIHFFDKKNGNLLKRIQIDSSPIVALWRLNDDTLLAISQKGNVSKFAIATN